MTSMCGLGSSEEVGGVVNITPLSLQKIGRSGNVYLTS